MITSELDEFRMILRINGYIQKKLGILRLNGKEVYAVALDWNCTFTDYEERQLSDEQLSFLFCQTLGFQGRQEL